MGWMLIRDHKQTGRISPHSPRDLATTDSCMVRFGGACAEGSLLVSESALAATVRGDLDRVDGRPVPMRFFVAKALMRQPDVTGGPGDN